MAYTVADRSAFCIYAVLSFIYISESEQRLGSVYSVCILTKCI